MSDCNHLLYNYTRIKSDNGGVKFCVQCRECYEVLRLPEHKSKFYLRASEIPPFETIRPFIRKGVANV